MRKRGCSRFIATATAECCAIRKVDPLARQLAGLRMWMTGQRRDQSPDTRDAHRGRRDRSALRRRGRDAAREVEPARAHDQRRRLGCDPGVRRAVQPAACARLREHRLRAVYARDPARASTSVRAGGGGRTRARRSAGSTCRGATTEPGALGRQRGRNTNCVWPTRIASPSATDSPLRTRRYVPLLLSRSST